MKCDDVTSIHYCKASSATTKPHVLKMSGLITVRANWNAEQKEWATLHDKRSHTRLKKLCKLEPNRTCADCCAKVWQR